MRRKLSIIGVLLLALCLSGWGSVLAAALSCPHAAAQDHSCCHDKHAQKKAQDLCSTPEHEAMGDMQMMAAPVVADAATLRATGTTPCAHCMERSEIPATPDAFQLNQVRRSVDVAAPHTPTPLAPFAALFTPPVRSRQGSPPGTLTRKHLLLGVFII
jgi:hypothetical protein